MKIMSPPQKLEPMVRLSVLFAAVLFAIPAFADDCDFTAQREDSADAGGVEKIEIDAAAGYLRVIGEEGASQIRASGEACASSERLLEDVQLVVKRSGDRVRISVEVPDSNWGRQTARLDLTVNVPASATVDIEDSSGSIEVENVAALEIEDGSGKIDVKNVAGNLEIDDGSGEIEARDIGGEVRIEDGSGQIELSRVGSVMIEEDGSGEIDVEEVTGSVMVRSDGSGSISVRDVGGDFTVRRDGSGGIRHKAVAGVVDVPDEDRDG